MCWVEVSVVVVVVVGKLLLELVEIAEIPLVVVVVVVGKLLLELVEIAEIPLVQPIIQKRQLSLILKKEKIEHIATTTTSKTGYIKYATTLKFKPTGNNLDSVY